MWRRWLFKLQAIAGMTERETKAFLLLSLIILAGVAARALPKSRILYDNDFYAELDAEFNRLSARADSIDASWLQVESERESAPAAIESGTDEPQLRSGRIDLNSATEAELESLPRIGPATAARILAMRSRLVRFESVDDLLMVQGIGEKTLAAIRDSVYVLDSRPARPDAPEQPGNQRSDNR